MENNLAATYLLYNPSTGEGYVGSTVDAERRMKQHLNDLKKNKHYNPRLQRSFNRNHNFEVLVVPVENRREALEFEQILLDEFWGNPKLLNLARAAEAPSLGKPCSPETREKIRQSQLGQKRPTVGPKLREMRLGIPLSEEHRSKVLEGQKKAAEKTKVKVEVDGDVYDSVTAAARSYGITTAAGTCRLNNDNFPTWKRL